MNAAIWVTIDPNENVPLGPSITQGGEGEIFASRPGRLVKMYFQPNEELAAKVGWMTDNPLPPLPRNDFVDHAWPERIVTRSGRFVGFEMDNLEGMVPLAHILDEELRQTAAPNWTYRHSVRLACNLAQAFSRLHRHDVFVGDVSPSNLLVDAERAYCAAIDLDSARINAQTRIFPCRVSTIETAAPEVLRGDLAFENRNESQDSFGLAVLVYRLLLLHHPYSGVMMKKRGAPLNLEQRICQNVWPFADIADGSKAKALVRIPPHGMSAVEALSDDLLALFHAAFNLGFIDPQQRPSPRRFVPVLESFYRALKACPKNPKHFFHTTVPTCPLCEVCNSYGFDPFPLQ